jgi:hypothetical protein
MLQKCANPQCTTPFRYLRNGKLFQVDIDRQGDIQISPVLRHGPVKTEYFWLCDECAASVTIKFDSSQGLIVAPLSTAAMRRARAAS